MDLTAAQAEKMQRHAIARDQWLVWLVSTAAAEHPGKAVAWAVVADTLEDLRAMLPGGLTRSYRTPFMPLGVVETWD